MPDYQATTQERILDITSRLEKELGLDGWLTIRHQFHPGFDGDHTIDSDGNATVYKTTAITTPQWEYRFATITWYLKTAVTQTDQELEAVAIHEYIHILLAPVTTLLPIKPLHTKLEEYVTECLMRLVGHARGMTNIR